MKVEMFTSSGNKNHSDMINTFLAEKNLKLEDVKITQSSAYSNGSGVGYVLTICIWYPG